MFIFLLALGEDYNILVMTRIREEARHMELRPAVIRAVGRTGPTVTSAGMVLAGTFAVLAFSAGSGPGSSQVRDIGFGLAIGILMDTFLVRTLLVPSTVALLGRWNWWPSSSPSSPMSPASRPGRRAHRANGLATVTRLGSAAASIRTAPYWLLTDGLRERKAGRSRGVTVNSQLFDVASHSTLTSSSGGSTCATRRGRAPPALRSIATTTSCAT